MYWIKDNGSKVIQDAQLLHCKMQLKKERKKNIFRSIAPQSYCVFVKTVLANDEEDETVCSPDSVVNKHNCKILGSENLHVTYKKLRSSPK